MHEADNVCEDDVIYENSHYLIGVPFDDHHRWAMSAYDLKDYMLKENYDDWKKLSNDERIEYCYTLFDVLSEDKLSLLRQVEVFEKLIHIDFKNFSYESVIECLFQEYIELGYKAITQIPYDPLVPEKYYREYINKLKLEDGVGHLQIPLEDTEEYFLPFSKGKEFRDI